MNRITLSDLEDRGRTLAEPPIWRQIPVVQHIVRGAPERPFCFADVY